MLCKGSNDVMGGDYHAYGPSYNCLVERGGADGSRDMGNGSWCGNWVIFTFLPSFYYYRFRGLWSWEEVKVHLSFT